MTGYLLEDIILFTLAIYVVVWAVGGLLGWIFMFWLFLPAAALRWLQSAIRRFRQQRPGR